MLRFLIEPSAFYRWFWGSRGKDCPGTNGQCPSFSWTHQPSRGNETTSLDPRFLLGCGGSPAEKPRLSRRCGFSGGFCISPRNGVLVSGGYAKTPIRTNLRIAGFLVGERATPLEPFTEMYCLSKQA